MTHRDDRRVDRRGRQGVHSIGGVIRHTCILGMPKRCSAPNAGPGPMFLAAHGVMVRSGVGILGHFGPETIHTNTGRKITANKQQLAHDTKQDKGWAAYTTFQSGGAEHQAALGDGCDECYRIGVDILRFRTFDDFCEHYQDEDDDAWHTKAEAARAHLRSPEASGATKPAETSHRITYECEILKKFKAVDATTLKKRLGMTRLTNKATAGVINISGPSLTSPGDDEVYYLFAPEASASSSSEDMSDGLDLVVRAKFAYEAKNLVLTQKGNAFDGHALSEMKHAAGEDSAAGGLSNAAAKTLMTLEEFVASHRGGTPKPAASGGNRFSVPLVMGRAAEEYDLEAQGTQEQGDGDDDLEVDLTDQYIKNTPRKGAALLGNDFDANTSLTDVVGDGEEEFEEDEGGAGDSCVQTPHSEGWVCDGFLRIDVVGVMRWHVLHSFFELRSHGLCHVVRIIAISSHAPQAIGLHITARS